MKARCLTSFFSQNINGTQGTTIEVKDQATFDDLVKVGYVEAVESEQKNVGDTPKEVTKAKAKKVTDKHEG